MENCRLACMRALAAALTSRLQRYCRSASASSTAASANTTAVSTRRSLDGNLIGFRVLLTGRKIRLLGPGVVFARGVAGRLTAKRRPRTSIEEYEDGPDAHGSASLGCVLQGNTFIGARVPGSGRKEPVKPL